MRYLIFLLIIVLFSSCAKEQERIEKELSENWQFSQADSEKWYSADVPGTIHSDLLMNNTIPDFKEGFNEDSIQWVEEKDWIYKTQFEVFSEVLQKDKILLQFFGLDTYADIKLNGEQIGSSDNMFLKKEIDVKSKLKEGKNLLQIYFHSPVKEGLKKLAKQPYLLQIGNEQKPKEERTRIYTRKAPFHYGWDWGPRVVTSGIWRPIKLVAFNDFRITDVRIETKEIENLSAKLQINVEVESLREAANANLIFQIGATEHNETVSLKIWQNKFEFMVDVSNPKLWWSNGLGKPNMYDFTASVSNNVSIARYSGKTGIRTIELVQEPDSIGRSFYFKLNGVPVFAKGANYIPSEILTPLQNKETYMRVINDALEANMNMLRVWGGGIYEEDLFYELCDENGIMIWQDFMFACDMSPFDKEHLENIKKEAEYNVKRLQNNPSIVLWCGNNENLLFYEGYGWKKKYNKEQQKELEEVYSKIFYEILADAVKKHDPELSYWPSSPQTYDNLLSDRKSGNEHDWKIWFQSKPFADYEKEVPRFVSEYGLQAYPSVNVVKSYTDEKDMFYNSKMLQHRQRSDMYWLGDGWSGNNHMRLYTERYFGESNNFKDNIFLTQLMQAYGYKTAIEIHRRNMPRTMGSLYWQLNDCWPAQTWSTVDYYGNWKASHYSVKKSYSQDILSLKNEDNRLKVFYVSDNQKPISKVINIDVIDFNGQSVFNKQVTVNNIPMHAQVVFDRPTQDVISNLDTNNCVVLLSFEGEDLEYQNEQFLTRPKWLDLQKAQIQKELIEKDNKKYIKLNTDTFVYGAFLSLSDKDLRLSDNYFNLIPGKEKIVEIKYAENIDEEDIVVKSYNSIKTANDFKN